METQLKKIKNIKKTRMKKIISTINMLYEQGENFITTKKLRYYLNVPSNNRSYLYFIWKTLDVLEAHGFLSRDGVFSYSKKYYKISPSFDQTQIFRELELD
ncbi:MAG: hypothetical protein ACTSXH_13145 [Promethearchaeota archaeon]